MISDYLESSIKETTYSLYAINSKRCLTNTIEFYKIYNTTNKYLIDLLANKLDIVIGNIVSTNNNTIHIYYDLIVTSKLFGIRIVSTRTNLVNSNYLANKFLNKELLVEHINKELTSTLKLLN